MLVFHGTTKAQAEHILAGGEKDSGANVWQCSDDSLLYVYPLAKVIQAEELQDEDEDTQIQSCVRYAASSAEISAAVTGHDEITVLCWDVPEEYLEDDYSCENMHNIASQMLDNPALKFPLLHRWDGGINPELRVFYLTGLVNRADCPVNSQHISKELWDAARQVHEAGIYLDSLLDAGFDSLTKTL